MTSIYKYGSQEQGGKAQLKDLDASYKDLSQLCRAIRRQPLLKAKKILNGVIELKQPIQYYKFKKGMGHRSQLKGQPGRWPKKEAKMLLTAVNNAEANAKSQGLEVAKLVVKAAIAYKQNTMKRHRKYWVTGTVLGYGKQAIWANYVTARLEVVLGV
ncbi:50S ribosomal protein L22 [uncultured archaeon]|nr:50S ribosomal protein L22 [uncultured archaeon]